MKLMVTRKTTLTSGASFDAMQVVSILESAAAAGVALPHSCKIGRCGACKCKVLNGETLQIQPETSLSDQEKAEGWILICVRSPQTDLLLEAEDLSGISFPTPKTFACRISNLKLLSPEVLQVRLRLPPAIEFDFIPGQYISVIGPEGTRRSYSIANSSFDERHLELHIRAVKGGIMSEFWFNQAKLADLLRFHGPLGTFFLRDVANIDLIFLATGTGIAPVRAMLGSLTNRSAQERPRSVTLLW